MWNLNSGKMCNRHLLGEHKEMHQVVGMLNARKSVKGHVEYSQLEVYNIKKRHDEIVKEMKRRSFKHKFPLPKFKSFKAGRIDLDFNEKDLVSSCQECRKRFGK